MLGQLTPLLRCPGCARPLVGSGRQVDRPEWVTCPDCGRASSSVDLVRPFARVTGQLWIFGVVLMALAVRETGNNRLAAMGVGISVTILAALRTWNQYRALAPRVGAPPKP